MPSVLEPRPANKFASLQACLPGLGNCPDVHAYAAMPMRAPQETPYPPVAQPGPMKSFEIKSDNARARFCALPAQSAYAYDTDNGALAGDS